MTPVYTFKTKWNEEGMNHQIFLFRSSSVYQWSNRTLRCVLTEISHSYQNY